MAGVTAGRSAGGSTSVDTQQHPQPLTINVECAGRLLGISRGLAYDLVRRGEIPAIRLGRRLVVPAVAIDEILHDRPARSA
jgi:excisionase family DNA binding protein